MRKMNKENFMKFSQTLLKNSENKGHGEYLNIAEFVWDLNECENSEEETKMWNDLMESIVSLVKMRLTTDYKNAGEVGFNMNKSEFTNGFEKLMFEIANFDMEEVEDMLYGNLPDFIKKAREFYGDDVIEGK